VILALILSICNFAIPRNASNAWTTAYKFAKHASYKPLDGSSVRLQDTTPTTHANCNKTIFNTEKLENKCKRMRSGPMYFDTSEQGLEWPFLEMQSAQKLFMNIFFIFVAFASIWLSQYAITEHETFMCLNFKDRSSKGILIFVAVCVSLLMCVLDIILVATGNQAQGSLWTGVSFFAVLLLISVIEYNDTRADRFVAHAQTDTPDTSVKPSELSVENGPAAQETAQETPVAISHPKREHMHRHIYLSYASLLMFPLVVLFILANSHTALVDVHVQLVFFSFVFYGGLDVFQTRATAVLLCLPGPPEDVTNRDWFKTELYVLKFFVVFAFFLCKCFVLLPALVLLQTQYASRSFHQATLAVHYVVLFGFALADFVHILFEKVHHTDLLKLFFMFIYTIFIVSATFVVDL
jgi:hypothetical protein